MRRGARPTPRWAARAAERPPVRRCGPSACPDARSCFRPYARRGPGNWWSPGLSGCSSLVRTCHEPRGGRLGARGGADCRWRAAASGQPVRAKGALAPSSLPLASKSLATIWPGLVVPVRAVVRNRPSKVEPVAGATAATRAVGPGVDGAEGAVSRLAVEPDHARGQGRLVGRALDAGVGVLPPARGDGHLRGGHRRRRRRRTRGVTRRGAVQRLHGERVLRVRRQPGDDLVGVGGDRGLRGAAGSCVPSAATVEASTW